MQKNVPHLIFTLVCIFSCLLTNSAYSDKHAKAAPMRVAYIASVFEDGFWHSSLVFLQEVAKDLNVELDVYPIMNYREALQALTDITKKPKKTDYILYPHLFHSQQKMLTLAEANNIPSFVFNSDFPESPNAKPIKPRETFKYLLGHMYPDDYAIGKVVIRRLIDAHIQATPKLDSSTKINMLGLSGTTRTSPGIRRKKGMMEYVSQYPRVNLQRVVPMEWQPQVSQRVTTSLLEYYPNTHVIWSAGSSLTQGAVDAIKNNHLKKDDNILIGSCDLTPETLSFVKEGRVHVAVGGHFMEAGWALVLLYDYHHKIDFKEELGTTINLPPTVVDQQNVSIFKGLLQPENWHIIDFRKFSKATNPELTRYDFSAEKLKDVYFSEQ